MNNSWVAENNSMYKNWPNFTNKTKEKSNFLVDKIIGRCSCKMKRGKFPNPQKLFVRLDLNFLV